MKCYIHPSIDATQTCSECGKAICDACTMEINGKVYCRPCTEKLANVQAPTQAPPVTENPLGPTITKKEPLLALILSFFIPGLGHIYDGLMKKGISILIGFIIIWFFIFMFVEMTPSSSVASGASSSSPFACCTCLFLLAYLAIWIFGMYDSYMSAQRINKGEKVEDKLY